MSKNYLVNNSKKTEEYFVKEKENNCFYNKVEDFFYMKNFLFILLQKGFTKN